MHPLRTLLQNIAESEHTLIFDRHCRLNVDFLWHDRLVANYAAVAMTGELPLNNRIIRINKPLALQLLHSTNISLHGGLNRP